MSKNSAPSPVETKRNIGFNDDLISGDLKPLADLVRRSEHLELCYRGNDKALQCIQYYVVLRYKI